MYDDARIYTHFKDQGFTPNLITFQHLTIQNGVTKLLSAKD